MTNAHTVATKEESTVEIPIVIDLGKEKSKRIKALKRGRGKLLDEVAAAVEEVRANLGDEANGKVLVPVVLIYRKKSRRRKRGIKFPFLLS
ncbi:MAG: hypothetical protein AB1489_34205 [Acidobacteriota bacterium]